MVGAAVELVALGVGNALVRLVVDEGGDRVLVTVLFTDVVGATARAAELGDRRWRDVLFQALCDRPS
jgi:class 3 adenylate cyclase